MVTINSIKALTRRQSGGIEVDFSASGVAKDKELDIEELNSSLKKQGLKAATGKQLFL